MEQKECEDGAKGEFAWCGPGVRIVRANPYQLVRICAPPAAYMRSGRC
jgi:hypothetical protein